MKQKRAENGWNKKNLKNKRTYLVPLPPQQVFKTYLSHVETFGQNIFETFLTIFSTNYRIFLVLFPKG